MPEDATVTMPNTPPAVPATAPTPTPAVTAAQTTAAPSTVTIPLEQLQTFTSMQVRLAQLEADQKTRDEQTKAEMVAVLAKKGEVDNALALLRKQSDESLAAERGQRAATEARAARYALDGELSRVLASQPLIPHAAAHLTKLWRDQFKVEPQGESFVVLGPTHQSVEAFVVAALATPEYSSFVRAQNPGGGTGGVSSASQTAPSGMPTVQGEPQTLVEATLLKMKDMAAARSTGQYDPTQNFGFRVPKQA